MKFYRYTPTGKVGRGIHVGLIFDNRDRCLSAIQKHARALELAIPFPCTMSEPKVWECMKAGQPVRFIVTMSIGTRLKWPDAQKFLEGAGFREETQ